LSKWLRLACGQNLKLKGLIDLTSDDVVLAAHGVALFDLAGKTRG
jgi:hypothetical protein